MEMSMRVKYFCLHDDEAEAGIVNSKADFLSDPGSNRGLFFGKIQNHRISCSNHRVSLCVAMTSSRL